MLHCNLLRISHGGDHKIVAVEDVEITRGDMKKIKGGVKGSGYIK